MPTRMRSRTEQQVIQGVDMSSLLDVVFILLIFFIVSSVFVKDAGVEIEKPSVVSAQQLPSKVIYLSLTEQGQLFFEGNELKIAYLKSQLTPLLKAADRPVVIQADREVASHFLMSVIDEVKLAGASSINLAALKL